MNPKCIVLLVLLGLIAGIKASFDYEFEEITGKPNDIADDDQNEDNIFSSMTEDLSVIDDLHAEVSKTLQDPPVEVPIEFDEYTTIQSMNFPEPYPDEQHSYEWIIGLGSGFGVELIIRSLDLEGKTNDYLLISPGDTNMTSEKKIMFTWQLKTERKYRLLHLDELSVTLVTFKKTTPNTRKGFQIDVKRIGIHPTTTEMPSTTPPPVTVMPQEESTLYLSGMTPTQFLNISEGFRSELASVAEYYCKENNITIDENITVLENVNYHRIAPCTINWPDSDTCIEIIYSIPINLDNDTQVYELTREHLEDMWNTHSSKIDLASLGLGVYQHPDDARIVTIWVSISCGVILWFLIVLFLIWRCRCFQEIGSTSLRESLVSNKKSLPELYPMPHQSMPSLFGQDSYGMEERTWLDDDLPPHYEDDKKQTYKDVEAGQHNAGFVPDSDRFDLDSDEEIIMSLPDHQDIPDGVELRPKNQKPIPVLSSYDC